MKIAVRNRDFGFWSAKPVTVQVKYLGHLISCNHDGYEEEDYVGEALRPDDTIRRWFEKHEVCDKCYAWRVKGDEEWNDEPASQPVRF